MLTSHSLIFLSLSVALQVVLGSSVKLTNPKSNAVLKAGSTVNIKWHVNDKKAGPIRLQYASGKASSLNVDGVIADNVTASLGSYTWTIPSDIKADKYVIEAGPNAKDLSFAGYVTIKNDSKKTTSTKKTSTKKTTTTTRKAAHSAICVGYPSKKNSKERVRCHSVPEASAASVKKGKKKITTRSSKKSKKASTKKTTKKAKKTAATHKKTTTKK
ncbi:unnamed protein product [Rhizopus stolonifer]